MEDALSIFYDASPNFFMDEFIAHYCGGSIDSRLISGLRCASRIWSARISRSNPNKSPDDLARDAIIAGDVSYLRALRERCMLNYNRALCAAAAAGRSDICALIREWSYAWSCDAQIKIVLKRTDAISRALENGHEEVARDIIAWDDDCSDIRACDILEKSAPILCDSQAIIVLFRELHAKHACGWHEMMTKYLKIVICCRDIMQSRATVDQIAMQYGPPIGDESKMWQIIATESARIGDLATLRVALSRGASHKIAMEGATEAGNLTMCKFINILRLTTQPRPIEPPGHWFILSQCAGYSGNLEVCQYIFRGIAEQDRYTAIMYILRGAALGNHADICWFAYDLLRELPDLHFYREMCDCCLEINNAARYGNSRILELLLAFFDLDIPRVTFRTLGWAAGSGDVCTWKITVAHSRIPDIPWARLIPHAMRGGNGWIVHDICIRANIANIVEVFGVLCMHPIHERHVTIDGCECDQCKLYQKLQS
jgi:hypothetical protein